MKILTEKQQIEKQAKEVFQSYQYMSHELSKLQDKLNNYRVSLFSRESKERVLLYEASELKKAVTHLDDYQAFLYNELKKHTENKNTIDSRK